MESDQCRLIRAKQQMAADTVKVSMYNVGFGDCFLLRFPGLDRERRVLIDCGSIKQGKAGATEVIVRQIIEDLSSEGPPRLDVVAMSHRHKDHVSGFANEAWGDVEVGEIWLPWIENPGDDRARQILQEMASFAFSLQEEMKALKALGRFSAAEKELIDHVISNSLTLSNERALNTLHRGFKGGTASPRKFLSRSASPLDTNALPGVTVHVLGPSKDEEVIRDMNPPSKESFLRAAAGLDTGETGDFLPFPISSEFPTEPGDVLKDFLRQIADESALLGAAALEGAVNNTSLMLVFEVGDAVLFFPGDSQWGSWKVNLDDPLRRQLLERTTFYKIGHHGSHNSTPVTFAREILNNTGIPGSMIWAAASVTPHGKFTEIPKSGLLTELGTRITQPKRVVRSDKPPTSSSAPAGLKVHKRNGKPIRLDFEVPI